MKRKKRKLRNLLLYLIVLVSLIHRCSRIFQSSAYITILGYLLSILRSVLIYTVRPIFYSYF